MNIENNKPLITFNTLKVDAYTKYFVKINSENDLSKLINTDVFKSNNRLILGGGSNILFTKNFDGLTVYSAIKNIEMIEENDQSVFLKVGSGVEWDNFVDYCVQRNWGGVENLSDIPGNVGAAPVQNIGAYGVEAKDTIKEVHTFNLNNGHNKIFTQSECNFGYRYSIFKKGEYKSYFIVYVVFELSKNPVLHTSYGRVDEEMKKHSSYNIQTLRRVITSIRQSKLPSVHEVASAGSFFKNPVVDIELARKIKKEYPDMPVYKIDNYQTKIPAAWFIEKCGLKGFSDGRVKTFELQPLVIINTGNASGQEIVEFSEMVQARVKAKFNIILEPEVCFV